MNGLVAIGAIFSLVALLYLASTVRSLRRGRLLRAGGSATMCVATATLGTAGVLLFVSYLGYERLTAESLVGEIQFTRSAPEEYTARLMIEGRMATRCPGCHLEATGDHSWPGAGVSTRTTERALLIRRSRAQRTAHGSRPCRGTPSRSVEPGQKIPATRPGRGRVLRHGDLRTDG
jgi:hypothetical protein